MNSMTGYGRGESLHDGIKFTVEVTSVNRKQGEIFTNMPRELETLEPRIRDLINERISRGRVTVKITTESGSDRGSGTVVFNADVAALYLKEFQKLKKKLGLAAELPVESLIRSPGVVEYHTALEHPERLWRALGAAVKEAMDQLSVMRNKEGTHLAEDLTKRMKLIRKSLLIIERAAPAVSSRYRDALRQRIAAAGLELPDIEEERLLKEVVYFADRSDITEEITRLKSHFQQFDETLATKEPIGRKLDFLVQEMNREINTIGSKANDSVISREVVNVKAELERFREQAQNVE